MSKHSQNREQVSTLFTFFNEIGIISQLSGNLFERNLPMGLTNSQFSVLNWFHRVDDVATPSRLARAFQVTGGAMTNTLKRLESKGLVKVMPDPDSGRQKRVTITAKGRKLRDTAIAASIPLFTDFASEFPPEKLQKQIRELKKIRQFLDESRYNQTE